MNYLIFFSILATTYSFPFDDDTFKMFISSTKGTITKKKLTTKKNVTYLDISFSTIEGIEPDSLCAIPNLQTLFINGNAKFPKLTKQLFSCTKDINYISFDADQGFNQEYDRDTFNDLSKLTFLKINDVNISHVGKDLFKGLDLELLNLVSCKITTIDADSFSMLPNLKGLHLGHNYIKSFKLGTFANLPKLTELMLNKNEIDELKWENWDTIPSLRKLDFGDNHIKVCNVTAIKIKFPLIKFFNAGGNFGREEEISLWDEAKKLNFTLRDRKSVV